jgi:hypothetical protein
MYILFALTFIQATVRLGIIHYSRDMFVDVWRNAETLDSAAIDCCCGY